MGSANLSGAVLVNDTVTKAETFGGLNRATMAVGFPTVQALHACCCGVVRGIYRQRQHSTHAVCRHIRRASEFA